MAKWKDESQKTIEVVKGDSLSTIAADSRFSGYISGTGIYGDNGKVNTLAELNDIEKPDYLIYVGQILKLQGNVVKSTNKASSPTIKSFALQSNTDSTLFATWNWDKSNTENYRTMWYYDTGDGVWFVGSDSTTTYKQSTYSIPSNAERVRFKVLPKAKKKKVNGKETPYWTAEWSTYKTYNVSSAPPATPTDNINVSIDHQTMQLTASIDVKDLEALNATHIEFKVYKNEKYVHTSGKASISKTGHAEFTCKVAAANTYRVICRAVRGSKYSEWTTPPTASVSTVPPAISKFSSCKLVEYDKDAKTGIVSLSWPGILSATAYEIKYTDRENPSKLLDDQWSTLNDNISKDYTSITNENAGVDLEGGKTYYFKIRVKNEAGVSKWSSIASVIIGSAPSAPTVWSSRDRITPDDEVALYWTHNSQDNSDLVGSALDLVITVGDKVVFEITDETYLETDKKGNFLTAALDKIKNFISIGSNSSEDDEDKNTGSFALSAANWQEGGTIKWRVRTKGSTDTYGDFSEWRTINIYENVMLGLGLYDSTDTLINDSNLYSLPMKVASSFTSVTQKPIGYHLSITARNGYETVDHIGNDTVVTAGQSIYSKWFDDVDDVPDENDSFLFEITLSAGDVRLENNATYDITCSVALDSGLSSESISSFTVSWDRDPDSEVYEPNAEIVIDEKSLTASIRPYCEDVDGNILDNVELSVYRREFDGSFTELATGINNENYTYVTDPHPALDYARYRIVALYKNTGVVVYSDPAGIPVKESAVVIQWDEQWTNFDTTSEDMIEEPTWAGSMVKLPYNIDVSDKYAKDIQHIQYIGRSHPVSYFGTHVGSTSSWKVEIESTDIETLYALRRLAVWMGNVYVREPSGSGYWATIEVSIGQTHNQLTIPVNIEVTRVEGGA